MKKLTVMLPSNSDAGENSHEALTHKEWCVADISRRRAKGADVLLEEEWRVYDPYKRVVEPFTEGSNAWCRIDRR